MVGRGGGELRIFVLVRFFFRDSFRGGFLEVGEVGKRMDVI